MNFSINNDQRLFVIPAGEGFSCLGFDYLFSQLKAIANKLGLNEPKQSMLGTLEQYQEYKAALNQLRLRGGFSGTWFSPEAPKKVQRVLEQYRKTDEKIHLYYGDVKTGRDWLEENDVVGRVGRSTGLMKIPLLIPDNECGGPSILDRCIVKMQDVETGEVLYQAKNYHLPAIKLIDGGTVENLPFEVLVDGEVHARFETLGKAARWVALISGECQ